MCYSDFSIGHYNTIKDFLNSNKNFLYNEDPVEVIKFLINLESENNPKYVGSLIDILQINKDGFNWI